MFEGVKTDERVARGDDLRLGQATAKGIAVEGGRELERGGGYRAAGAKAAERCGCC